MFFKTKISPKLVSLVFSVLVVCFAVGFYVFAWVDPGEPPPGDNVPLPLNTGSDFQTKDGALAIGKGLAVNNSGVPIGLIVEHGKVGIGTTTPDFPLDMRHGASGVVARFVSDDGTRRQGLYITTSLASPYLTKLHSSGTAGGGGDMAFYTGNDQRMYIQRTTGNVGIGTSSPGYKLDVTGDIAASGRYADFNTIRTYYLGTPDSGTSIRVRNDLYVGSVYNTGGMLEKGTGMLWVAGITKAAGGLIIETRASDPSSQELEAQTGRMWLRTDL